MCLIGDSWCQASFGILESLIYGNYTIKRKPWKPDFGYTYWIVNNHGEIEQYTWTDHWLNNFVYKLGNCYRTREEAVANRDKWIAFYESDEILEV